MSNVQIAREVGAQCTLREQVGLPREILQLSENVSTQRRGISHKMQPLLDRLDSVPDFSVSGSLSTRNPDLQSFGLKDRFNLNSSQEGLDEFESEVEQLVYDLGKLADVEHAAVTVCVTRNTTCSRLHVDNVGLRILCTYRGPGTEWVASPVLNRIMSESVRNGGNSFSDAIKGVVTAVAPIKRAEEGEVVILKGQGFPNSRGRAIVHRSPLVAEIPGGEDKEFVRLLVKIDDGCC
eukprot:CAMPEP_0118927720 /NCGR_PEP_ID=MMETSP1169-20130426/5138_1 /TAXON_ID=36882 /ORGANISM="Pyramimonas obovata, Strain CCMP722" /LENGTH=235 /DNA_ID=CAMNT_0006869547 /DNA_START=191 /DNA_END=898 /DNA_ORIENTATION=-